MIPYASRTGTKKNLAALREFGWRLLVSASGPHRSEGFSYCIDNGAWTAFQKGTRFDEGRFMSLLDRLGAGADWIVVPDVVGDRVESLRLTERWLPRLERYPRLLVSVQDGMTYHDVRGWLGSSVGIFLGGSTEWKMATLDVWGIVSRDLPCYYHVARVNSEKRILMARSAGAHSVDGSNASRFSVTVPRLDRAVRRPIDGFEPRTDGWFQIDETRSNLETA